LRGDVRAYRLLDEIEAQDAKELAAWYHRVQMDLIERNAA
jgi:hypothetical protein